MCNHCAISCRLPINYDGSFHHRRRCNTTKQPYPYKVSKVRFDKIKPIHNANYFIDHIWKRFVKKAGTPSFST